MLRVCSKYFDVAIFSHIINTIKVPLCLMVEFIDLDLVIPLLVTAVSSVKQF